MRYSRKFVLPIVAVASIGAASGAFFLYRATPIGWNRDKSQFMMPNGWKITHSGQNTQLPGDMPGGIVYVDGGTRAVVNTCGYNDHSLSLIDLKSKKVVATKVFPRLWVGLAESKGRVFVSGGGTTREKSDDNVMVFDPANGLDKTGSWTLDSVAEGQRYVSSIVARGNRVYVLNLQSDEVFLFDLNGKMIAKNKVGYRPFGAALSPDGATLAVTEWGNQSVALLDSATLNFKARYSVGPHPSSIAWHRDGRIFVTESSSNTLAVIRGTTISRVAVSVDSRFAVGPMPQSVCFSPDGKKGFVALGGDNAVAVLDLTQARPVVIGHIPTMRFPSVVSVTPDGNTLIAATAKGFYGPNGGKSPTPATYKGRPDQYIGSQLDGHIQFIPMPNRQQLAKYTMQAIANQPTGVKSLELTKAEKSLAESNLKKIKHAIFVIKENRTYDQVLGDLPKGNGDPTLTLFGRKVTPNIHKIAEEYMTFDNLFTDGETSQAGHQWTTSAYASDYTEKAWILGYSSRPDPKSDMRMTSSPEYLWTLARKHGKWARVYGEYVDVQEDHNSLNAKEMIADPEKYGYSEAWERVFAKGGRDTEKIEVFRKELAEFERTGKMPHLMVMALPDDHTHGFSVGAHSPNAMVGDNDQAVARLVEMVSKSKFWAETAIFVIQDDAQAGPDHVDSHRTVGLVISPYSKRKVVDSSHYTTSSMLRTMEMIMGLPPMTSYDGLAAPMHRAFLGKLNLAPFVPLAPGVDLDEINPPKNALAERSAKLDFSASDKADFNELNRILWAGIRPGEPYPGHLAGR